MHADPIAPQTDPEGLVAELTAAAYGFALRHGFTGTFIEVELGLWDALRARQGRIRSSRRRRHQPDHPPVRTSPSRHQHDRRPSMRRHPRLNGVPVRRRLPEPSRATSRQTLEFDEASDDQLAVVELLDEAIEHLYGGRRRVGHAPGKGPSHRTERGGRIPGR